MSIVRAIYSLLLIAGGILCLATDYLQSQGISLFFIFALFIVRGGYELNKVRKAKVIDTWEELLYKHRSKSLIFYYLFHLIFIVVGVVSLTINYQEQLPLSGFLIGLSFIIFGLLGLTDISRYVQYTQRIAKRAEELEQQVQEINRKRIKQDMSSKAGSQKAKDSQNNKVIEIKDRYRAKRKAEIKKKIKNSLKVRKKLRLNKKLKIKKNQAHSQNVQASERSPGIKKMGRPADQEGANFNQENTLDFSQKHQKNDQEMLKKELADRQAAKEQEKLGKTNKVSEETADVKTAAKDDLANKIIDFNEAKRAKTLDKKADKENNSIK